jgi:segregation and condensation protein A
MADYKFKLDVFEGPLDLLLHLVKINEMDIYDIPIAKITRQYLDYLKLIESLDLEIAGEYLVMAATLVNIKLRALLPDSPEEEEMEEAVEDIMSRTSASRSCRDRASTLTPRPSANPARPWRSRA